VVAGLFNLFATRKLVGEPALQVIDPTVKLLIDKIAKIGKHPEIICVYLRLSV
jgi:hypothetical protein